MLWPEFHCFGRNWDWHEELFPFCGVSCNKNNVSKLKLLRLLRLLPVGFDLCVCVWSEKSWSLSVQALDVFSFLSQRFGMQISEWAPGLNAEPFILCGTILDPFLQNQVGLQEPSTVHDKCCIPAKYECKWFVPLKRLTVKINKMWFIITLVFSLLF